MNQKHVLKIQPTRHFSTRTYFEQLANMSDPSFVLPSIGNFLRSHGLKFSNNLIAEMLPKGHFYLSLIRMVYMQ